MRPVPDGPVFDRTAARALGWSDSALSRAVSAGRLVQVRRGWFARPGQRTDRIAALAAVSARSGTVISHRAAAAMHGLPIVGARSPVPELTVPPRGPVDVAGAHLYRATLRPEDIVLVDGVPVTSVARTVIDLSRSRSTACGVAAIDNALHRRLITCADLDEVLLTCWNWPGIRRAQRAVRLADGRAESPLESVSRLVIRWLRLPAPELQVIACDRFGDPVGRLDFYWDEFGVAGESDGKGKYRQNDDDPDDRTYAFPLEKVRQERLEDERMVFVRWGWDQPWRQPQLLRQRLLNGFERGLARDRSGLTRYWSILTPPSGQYG